MGLTAQRSQNERTWNVNMNPTYLTTKYFPDASRTSGVQALQIGAESNISAEVMELDGRET